MNLLTDLKFDERGLIPAIAQDHATNEVLMLAYMNREAVQKTLETRRAHYFSRSRSCLWLKGETSGHYQDVCDIRYDCDMDALLLVVKQHGEACHTGERSCFYRSALNDGVTENNGGILDIISDIIKERRENPKKDSYTNYLLEKGNDKILKKIGEEAAEVIIAVKNENKEEVTYETADLLYHLSVCLVHNNLSWAEVFGELDKRMIKSRGKSDEKSD